MGEVVLLGNPLHLDVSVAVLHTEHLEVALVEESALHFVYGLEGDWDLEKLQVVNLFHYGINLTTGTSKHTKTTAARKTCS